jgi:hypothetical protein
VVSNWFIRDALTPRWEPAEDYSPNNKPRLADNFRGPSIQSLSRVASPNYGHDLDKLFAEALKREQLSGHPLVEPPKRKQKAEPPQPAPPPAKP